jgi:DNA invertase Pin-like site-specific DNA recombinase
MGSEQGNTKVTAAHRQRHAYLYIRQSTLRQVFVNTESTHRQYALRDQALALGWASEQIRVIDSDLGKSGAERDRAGFQQLVTEVSLDRVGMVMSLEVSRLARNSTDWHRLLELCALTDTLILDEDGLYNPAHFNDRLVLGLKGTMSEAELHVLRARLQGGIRNKARRGDLRLPPPVGLVYDPQARLALDPDQQVQDAVRLVFATFARTGSPVRWSRGFGTRGYAFPAASTMAPSKATWCGATSVIPAYCISCIIRAMLARSCLAVCARGEASTGVPPCGPSPRSTGRWCCLPIMPATLPGRRLSPINSISGTMPKRAVWSAKARRGKDRPSYKAWSYVAAVATV